MSAAAHLQAIGITKRFGGVTANAGIDLEIHPNQIVGLIGPNGAGKTTFFNCITGFEAVTEGRVLLDDEDITARDPVERARLGMTRTFQQAQLFPHLTVRENLLLGRNLHYAAGPVATALRTPAARRAERDARQVVEAIAEEFHLASLLDTGIDRLPYGTRRMVEVARAFATEPRVLLLDEPAAGMDSRESGHFGEVLRAAQARRDLSVLLIEHDVPLVLGLCDQVHVIDFGRPIAAGTPEHVRDHPDVRAAYLGSEVPAHG